VNGAITLGNEENMDDVHTIATNALARQAFSKLVGAELMSISPGSAELALPIKDSLTQQHGLVHGGVVSYLADNALAFAGGSVLGNSVTLEMKINYLRPAVGERLVASAKVVSSSKRFAVCECRVTASTGAESILVAAALGTICKVDAP
jgi:uncharacterized protein (TIGR00369 family)